MAGADYQKRWRSMAVDVYKRQGEMGAVHFRVCYIFGELRGNAQYSVASFQEQTIDQI